MGKIINKIKVLTKSLFTGKLKFEIARINRGKDTDYFLPKIDKEYHFLFKDYSERTFVKNEFSKNIFMYWHDGFNKTNELVDLCKNNIKKIYEQKGYRLYNLDYKSIKNNVYFNFDKYFIELFEKNKISVQYLADLIRLTAINELGGVRIDCSVLITSFIDFELLSKNTVFNSMGLPYHVRTYDNVEYTWTSFLLFGSKDNLFCQYGLELFKQFINSHKKIPYLLVDMMICLGKKYNICNVNNEFFCSKKSNFSFILTLSSRDFDNLSDIELLDILKTNPQKLNFSMIKDKKQKNKIKRLIKIASI